MSIDADTTLADLVLRRPSSARVLARLGLDYCCGGRETLREACRERGLDPATVAVFLEHEDEPVALEQADWTTAPLGELCRHIVDEHHERLRWELPRVSELAARAAAVHGDALPELHELEAELEALRRELEEHIADEEAALFPALAAGVRLDPAEVEQLRHEHDGAGARLRRLRELGGGYDVDRALCGTHRALLEGLHGLELDLHQHVHEENNILFPRALAATA